MKQGHTYPNVNLMWPMAADSQQPCYMEKFVGINKLETLQHDEETTVNMYKSKECIYITNTLSRHAGLLQSCYAKGSYIQDSNIRLNSP